MYAGVDVGATKTIVAVLDGRGTIIQKVKFPTPDSYKSFLSELKKAVKSFGIDDFKAACIAIPGRIDRAHGRAVGYGNLPWPPESIVEDAEKIFDCPTLIENDANLAALSESMLLKDKYNRVLYVTLSTGIGTGLIVNQRIDPGMADTEGGQMQFEFHGKLTAWEDMVSGRAIVERFGKKAADLEDPAAWKRIAHDLAPGFIVLIAVISPEVIVIGGSVGAYLHKFQPYLEAELKKYNVPLVPVPPILQAQRPEEAVVYGCYDLAKEKYGRVTQPA